MKGLFLLFLSSVIWSCDLPKDPHGTFKQLQSRDLKVGVVHSPPDTDVSQTPHTGNEIQLIKKFALQNATGVEFYTVNLETGAEMLKSYKIDVLIGGFTKSFTFNEVAWTSPYGPQKNIIMAVSPGENRLLTQLEIFLFEHHRTK